MCAMITSSYSVDSIEDAFGCLKNRLDFQGDGQCQSLIAVF